MSYSIALPKEAWNLLLSVALDDDTRSLNYVFICHEPSDNPTVAVYATDGHRLVLRRCPSDGSLPDGFRGFVRRESIIQACSTAKARGRVALQVSNAVNGEGEDDVFIPPYRQVFPAVPSHNPSPEIGLHADYLAAVIAMQRVASDEKRAEAERVATSKTGRREARSVRALTVLQVSGSLDPMTLVSDAGCGIVWSYLLMPCRI